ITVARPCTPTQPMIQGCSTDHSRSTRQWSRRGKSGAVDSVSVARRTTAAGRQVGFARSDPTQPRSAAPPIESDEMAAAVLVAVDGDADALADIERELLDRYGRHYRVVCLQSAADARAQLEALAASDEEVALILAAPRLRGLACSELLDDARRLHPHAKRGVLIPWGDWGEPATGTAIFDLIARGQVDHYVVRPGASPDELFHHTISGVLLDWAEAHRVSPHAVYVVGESWSGRAFEL